MSKLQFADYVGELRVKYKLKRNFIKLLDKMAQKDGIEMT
jgi:hypothetical protein